VDTDATTYVGLDVHKRTIAVAMLLSGGVEALHRSAGIGKLPTTARAYVNSFKSLGESTRRGHPGEDRGLNAARQRRAPH
jgi:hypothetical protein